MHGANTYYYCSVYLKVAKKVDVRVLITRKKIVFVMMW